MTADLYVRVSTDEQAEKGYSQRDQEERLRKYCELKQITIRKVIFEDHSAKTFNRPEWQHLLIDLKKHKAPVDLILFIKWDRFSRNAGDAYQMINILRKLGVEPQAIEQPMDLSVPENKMMLAFYLAAPEVENDRRALNTLHGMRRATKEGRWMGRAPVGYANKITEDGKKYIAPKEPEASIIKWVYNRLVTGQYHVEQVFEEARLKGFKHCKNTLWNVLRNSVYCGKINLCSYKDEEGHFVQGLHEPILSESLYYDVQDYLGGKKKNYKTTIVTKEIFQLRGYLICPRCGKLLTASTSRGRKERYSYYHCNAACGARFKAENANELFAKELKKFVPRSGMNESFKLVLNSVYKNNTKKYRDDIKNFNEQLNQANNDIIKARKLLLNDEIDAADYRIIKTECEKKINAIESRLIEVSKQTSSIDQLLEKALNAISQLEQLYTDSDVKKKRTIIGSVYPEKIIFDGMQYRTARLNEAVEMIYNIGKGFSKKETGQKEEDFNLSSLVARPGFEPRQTVPKTVVLPLYYRAILSQNGMQK